MNDDINFIKKLPIDEQKAYLKAYLKADQLETQTRVKGDFLEFKEIDKYCKKVKIDWFCSAWDINSVNFMFILLE